MKFNKKYLDEEINSYYEEEIYDEEIYDEDEEINNSITLYNNCEIIYTYFDKKLFIYAPKNELDIDLFNSLINSEMLNKEYITISKEMEPIYIHVEVFLLGNLCFSSMYNNYNYCNKCNLILPFDLEFYSNKLCEEIEEENMYPDKIILNDKYNLCYECYKNKNKLNKIN